MGTVKIGWAEESILPPNKKVSLAGQFFERISEYVESDITATAMAIEGDGEQAIIVSADIIGLTVEGLEIIREKFARLTDEVTPDKLIVGATHTHTSLRLANPKKNAGARDTKGILKEFLPAGKEYVPLVTRDESVITDEEALEFATDKVARAALAAWQNRKPASFTNEFGRAVVGMCRRVSYDDGSAQMWGDTNTANFVALEGGNDSGIELLYTFDENKNLMGVVANIACPAQILEQRSFISADYWGRARAMLREKLGEHVFLLGLCGAGGDQCPRDLVRWVEPETPIDDPNVRRPNPIKHKGDPSMYDISGCNRAGKRIANEIASVYEEITELQSEGAFRHKVIHLDLPLRKATMAEYNNAVRELEHYIEKNKDKEKFDFEDNARMHVYAGTIARYRYQQTHEVVNVEYHVLRLGNIAIVTNPFELFLDYGNRIKARSYAEQTFIIQLCCGSQGYLPTEKAEKAGHYSAYISSGWVGHEAGDLFTRENINEINKMFAE
ncbi:MAG: hypothetical protein IJ009_02705 [Clostridia bacterium]|nr:hypothetical protein [Clostridia bacterium]